MGIVASRSEAARGKTIIFSKRIEHYRLGNTTLQIIGNKQKSTISNGDYLGRLVLGIEDGEVKIFGATIF